MTPAGQESRFSYLTHLACARCGQRYDASIPQRLCECGSPLLARYDLGAVAAEVDRAVFASRVPSLWRYHELLPVQRPDMVVTLGEGMTPLVPLPRLAAEWGLAELVMKDEGLLPTGTFKARGAAVGISRARELGIGRIAMPTNGNAGAAWAAYAARAGMEALIVMPAGAPEITRAECAITGARLYLVDGLIGDAGAVAAGAVASQGYADASTLKEPYRVEGKKTMGLELFEQLGWRVPDVIAYPTGGGVGIIGIYKALLECQEMGWLGGKLPRLVAVQASGCAPIVRAWEEGASHAQPWQNAATVAFGITVPAPLGDFLILAAVRATGGCAIAVDDEHILAAQSRLAASEGAFICPEGAACIAAAERLRKDGWISAGDEVVVYNTGAGIKYPPAVQPHPPVIPAGPALPEA
ncbi:MAG: threonine synthase [Actinobacteria bacterium]|nr:threonine synthase [Actinomycetota bacterium]